VSHNGLLKYQVLPWPKTIPQCLYTNLSFGKPLKTQLSWRNQIFNARNNANYLINQAKLAKHKQDKTV